MTESRRPFLEMRAIIPGKKELTPYEGAQTICAAKYGIKPTVISARLSRPRRTITTTICLESERKKGAWQPRPVDHEPILGVTNDSHYESCLNSLNIPVAQLRAFIRLELSTSPLRLILWWYDITVLTNPLAAKFISLFLKVALRDVLVFDSLIAEMLLFNAEKNISYQRLANDLLRV